jgi:CTP synthase
MPEQEKKMLEKDYGGTMRLGEWPCKLEKETLAFKAYGKREIGERHRHRFEVNNDYRDQLEENGLIISGTSPDDRLVEIIELPLSKHPFFIGTQFHPEFTSRFLSPNPLFREFIKASAS